MSMKNPISTELMLHTCKQTSPRLWNYISIDPLQIATVLAVIDNVVELAIDKYIWKDILVIPPPAGVKLQFYTISGVCIYGTKESFIPNFVTHWAYCLPSPSKQAGGIK